MKDLKTLKTCGEFLTQNDEDILFFSHQTSSMKHHLTETHRHNFEIPNIVFRLVNGYPIHRHQSTQVMMGHTSLPLPAVFVRGFPFYCIHG